MPQTSVGQATVARLTGDTIEIPALTMGNVGVNALQIPSLASTSPLDIPAVLDTRLIGFDAGILAVSLHLTPSANSHIDTLEINHANASANVGQVVLHNVVLPYEVLNLTLSQIGVKNLAFPVVNVS